MIIGPYKTSCWLKMLGFMSAEKDTVDTDILLISRMVTVK